MMIGLLALKKKKKKDKVVVLQMPAPDGSDKNLRAYNALHCNGSLQERSKVKNTPVKQA